MTSKQNNLGALTFGLDIGIASVGWAVLGENRIVDLGVRCFDKAETAKEGESLNLARRTARLLRRRLRRRAWRLTKLARLLKHEGLISDVGLLKQSPKQGTPAAQPWQLRVDGLNRKLNSEEWARVIYHLCKHRGFHWISRAEEKEAESDSKSEGGKVKKGLAGTKKLMQENSYRTAAEMVMAEFFKLRTDKSGNPALNKNEEPIFDGEARNKQGDYSKALSRVLLSEEFALLFKWQRELGNPHTSTEFEAKILGNGDKKSGLFWQQNPALSGAALLKMLGRCTLARTGGADGKGEYRAPKASFTAERHVWLTRLNNLRIVVDGTTRPLNEAERRVALPLPYLQAGDLKYEKLRRALVETGCLAKDSFKFTGLAYSNKQASEEKSKDPEAAVLCKLPAWQTLRKTLKDAELETEWQKISSDALEGRPQLLDNIAWVLSVYKEDGEVETKLRELALPNKEKMLEALSYVSFDKFSNLSLKALYQIVPLMELGQRYDEAVANIPEYGHHSQLHNVGTGEHKYLPPFYSERDKDGRMVFNNNMDIPRNPVVLRALNQARKVVNALIKKYGSPHEVHIEMARDLSRPLDERREVEKLQNEFRDNNEKHKAEFASTFNIVGAVKGKEFEKYQLYREQQGKCAYSIEPIDLHRLFETGYVEIDHALPYSRSFDDSKNNRVLVLAKENRDKGNRTPYEYLDGKSDSERWRQFIGFVNGNKSYRLAKRSRLMRKDFGEDEAKSFRERNLNDTRYICKFFKNYVEQYLQLHADSKAKRCVVLSGQMTSFLRARWGLVKVRADSDRHHALDAVVVAACSHGMVKRLSDYSRRKELDQVREGFVDVETGEIVNPAMFQQVREHFPDPWSNFRDEVLLRLKVDDAALLRSEMDKLGTYPPDALEAVRPLFVSRAPQRRNSGAAHKETIYAQPDSLKAQGGVTQKVSVTGLKASDLDKLIDPHRNERLYAALGEWLTHRDEREKRAKIIEASAGRGKDKRELSAEEKAEIECLRALPRKPDKNGNPTGPVVRTVTMVIDKLSGIEVRGGIAKNDTMLRVDVFTKEGKYYLVPIYVHHAVAKQLPNRAATANMPREMWTLMDDSYQFCFSLHSNDLIRLKNRGSDYFGYFAGVGIATASLSIRSHDNNQAVATGKAWQGTWVNLGVKTGIECFQKFNIDVLGNLYPAPPETRRDLA